MGRNQGFYKLYEHAELGEPSEMEAMKRKFFQWLLSHNYSQETIKTQKYNLSRFQEWCRVRGILRPQEITREILELYQGQLTRSRKNTGESYSIDYLSRILTSIRGFFKWLAKNHHILYNPAAELELPRQASHIPYKVLNVVEVETLPP